MLFFGIFPVDINISKVLENSETPRFCIQVACVNGGSKIFPKPKFGFFVIFTTYRYCNPSKWPQMPQKWVNTIPFGKGHTLGTLNHGLESLFYCFITLFGLKSSLVPPGAPWCPLAPPWAPWCPPDPWYVILSHSQSSWVIMGHIWPIWGE